MEKERERTGRLIVSHEESDLGKYDGESACKIILF